MQNETILVTVTAEDIANGRPKSIFCCPNAIALQRATGCGKAWIGRMSLSLDGGDRKSQDTPPEVDEWIRKFDAGEVVEPISYSVFKR